ncbi:MAG: hypothetical protein FWD39_06270, partial [Clostridiales bacterium]|nr:hypothetical protein [Clostridiales bacterium]
MTVSAFEQATVVSFAVLPLLSLVILNLLSKNAAKTGAAWFCAVPALYQMGAALFCALLLWQNGQDSISFSVFWDMNAGPNAAFFALDYYSLLALFCVGLVSFAAVLVAQGAMKKNMLNFSNLLLVIMLGMNGIAMATDFFSLYIFLEITAIASFVLIALTREKRGLEGSFKYLVMSAVATAFLLVSLALIFLDAGTLSFAGLKTWSVETLSFLPLVSFVLLLAGLCIKAGIFPFHSWVPDAYQNAPPAVSVLLAGIVTKMAGVYIMLRVVALVLPQIAQMNLILMILGLLSIFYGAFAALGQSDFKRIL